MVLLIDDAYNIKEKSGVTRKYIYPISGVTAALLQLLSIYVNYFQKSGKKSWKFR